MIQDTLEEKRAKADAGIAERHFHKMGKLFNHTNLLYELPITNWWNLEFFSSLGATQWDYNRGTDKMMLYTNPIANCYSLLFNNFRIVCNGRFGGTS